MEFEREYGVACTVEVPMIKLASDDFAASGDWTPASGDTKISKDGGAAADLGSNPSALTMGNGATWKFSLTAAEMQAARVAITVVDATSGKAVKDQQINIRTFGHPSAADPRDVELAGTASSANTTTAVLAATSDFGANYLPGKRIQIVGTGAGTRPQDRMIASTTYGGGAYTVSFDRALDVAPTGTITYKIWRQIGPVTTAAVDSNGAVTVGAIANNAITANAIANNALAAAKFASGAFDAVWTVTTRVLTSGTNIVLAKGTGITGFNDLDASGIRGAVGLATANLDTQLGTLATAAALATVGSNVLAVKIKTDQMVFGVANALNVNVTHQNAGQVYGAGTSGNKWRGTP